MPHSPVWHILASLVTSLNHSTLRPWNNRGKCYMDGKRIQCWSNAYSSMYPSIFNRLRAIARYWSEIATFSYPLAFNAPVGGDPLGRVYAYGYPVYFVTAIDDSKCRLNSCVYTLLTVGVAMRQSIAPVLSVITTDLSQT